MIERSPAMPPDTQPAPPIKRAKPDGVPVRLYDGALVAHVCEELAEALLQAGAAEAFRRGQRRYIRLRPGISVPRRERGWDVIEFLRRWHGDKKAAAYVAHKDRKSETLVYRPANRLPQRPSEPRIK